MAMNQLLATSVYRSQISLIKPNATLKNQPVFALQLQLQLATQQKCSQNSIQLEIKLTCSQLATIIKQLYIQLFKGACMIVAVAMLYGIASYVRIKKWSKSPWRVQRTLASDLMGIICTSVEASARNTTTCVDISSSIQLHCTLMPNFPTSQLACYVVQYIARQQLHANSNQH